MSAPTRTAWAAGLLLAAAAGGWWLARGTAPEAAPPAPAPAVSDVASPTTAAAAPAVVAPAGPAARTDPVASPTAPSVVLAGLMVGADRQPLAVVSVDGRPEALVRVGDALGDAARVVHIDEASLTYRVGDRDLRVTVRPRDASASAAASAPAPAPVVQAQPGFVANAPPIARPAGTLPGSGNEAFRQAVERKLQAIAAGR